MPRLLAAAAVALGLSACASGPSDLADVAPPPVPAMAPLPAAADAAPAPGASVATAGPAGADLKTREEVRATEAELLALGARQQEAANAGKGRSVVEELKAVGRSHARSATRKIEAESAGR